MPIGRLVIYSDTNKFNVCDRQIAHHEHGTGGKLHAQMLGWPCFWVGHFHLSVSLHSRRVAWSCMKPMEPPELQFTGQLAVPQVRLMLAALNHVRSMRLDELISGREEASTAGWRKVRRGYAGRHCGSSCM